MNQIITKGIVLSRTNYQEADRILTLLTSDQGKVRVVAKGVRKNRSKMAGGTELLSVSEIGFIRGKGELSTLTMARLEVHYGNIVQSMDRTMYAYDILKRLNRLTEDNADIEYFDLLKETLAGLDQLGLDLELVQLWMAMQLLCISGNQPDLLQDGQGEALAVAQHYNFDTESMVFRVHPDGIFEPGHIKLLRLCQQQPLYRLVSVSGIESYVAADVRLVQMLVQYLEIGY